MSVPKDILETVEKLKTNRVDPGNVYRLDLGNGETHTMTGDQINKASALMVEVVSADIAGDDKALFEAITRLYTLIGR